MRHAIDSIESIYRTKHHMSFRAKESSWVKEWEKTKLKKESIAILSLNWENFIKLNPILMKKSVKVMFLNKFNREIYSNSLSLDSVESTNHQFLNCKIY